ncbi:MAG: hypothetical protein Q7S74_02110 [Nanoarchaeota archaeon]|nr:hypothetical protein [Nanoarchaeota archaeon]
MKTALLLIEFILIGTLFIVSNNNLHLNIKEERAKFTTLYYGWLGSLVSQGSQISGYVIKSQWLPPLNETSKAKPAEEDSFLYVRH